MLQRLTPTLYTRDLQTTIDFYQKILGFEIDSFVEEWGWAKIKRDGVEFMVSLPNEHLTFEQPNLTGSFYIYTDRVDQCWAELKELVSIAYPIEDFEHGMREFAIFDNNGYLIQFGEELPT